MHQAVSMYCLPLCCLVLTAHQASSSSSSSSSSSASHPKDGQITSLPGYSGQLRSRHFGGYITVDKAHNRNLYYYMVR
jgi:hypothetical protein